MERYPYKIQLLDRVIPMMVTKKEEEYISLAVRLIEEKIKFYKSKYNQKDDFHLVLMCCLDIANIYVKSENDHHNLMTYFNQKILAMDEHLEKSLDVPSTKV